VRRIGSRIVVHEVAADALGALPDVDAIVVTLLAGCRLVRPRERELSPRVIKRGGPRRGRVAAHAVCGERGLGMIGLRGLVVVVLVTGDTLRRCAGEIVSDVTPVAGHRAVRAGKRETTAVVIEPGRVPRHRAVALVAGRGESAGQVIRIGRRLVGALMAAHAVVRDREEDHLSLGLSDVARPAIGHQMGAIQRESGELVTSGHGRAIDEASGRVAAGADGTELSAVEILVAGHAGRVRVTEGERRVAGPAGGRGVRSGQGKALLRMVERTADPGRCPALRGMAGAAFFLKFAMRGARRLLSPSLTGQEAGK